MRQSGILVVMSGSKGGRERRQEEGGRGSEEDKRQRQAARDLGTDRLRRGVESCGGELGMKGEEETE